jgi:hypothetical protein
MDFFIDTVKSLAKFAFVAFVGMLIFIGTCLWYLFQMISLDNDEVYSDDNSQCLISSLDSRDHHLRDTVKSVHFHYYPVVDEAPSRIRDYRNLQSGYVVSEKMQIDEMLKSLSCNPERQVRPVFQNGVLHIIFVFGNPFEKAAYFKLYCRNGELEPLSYYDRYVVNGSGLLNYLLGRHPQAFQK